MDGVGVIIPAHAASGAHVASGVGARRSRRARDGSFRGRAGASRARAARREGPGSQRRGCLRSWA